jgi:hypothetical protein
MLIIPEYRLLSILYFHPISVINIELFSLMGILKNNIFYQLFYIYRKQNKISYVIILSDYSFAIVIDYYILTNYKPYFSYN